jgi:hypothetical protein
VRATRRVRELLADITRQAGTTSYHHPGEPRTQPFRSLTKGSLSRLGVSAKLSSRSQLVAKLPGDEFQARLDALRSAGRTPSLQPFVRASRGFVQPKRHRSTATPTRLQHALADVREICNLNVPAEVSATRALGFAVDGLLEAYEQRRWPIRRESCPKRPACCAGDQRRRRHPPNARAAGTG